MASKVEIINMACIEVGAAPILNIDETSTQARTAKAVYDLLRDALLNDFTWSFTKKRATLAQLSETPDHEFSYYYQIPSDSLRVIKLYAASKYYEFESEGKIATNDETVYITYVQKDIPEGRWHPLFSRALALDLARAMVEPLGKDSGLKQELADMREIAIGQAKRTDVIQDNIDEGQYDDTDWESAGRGPSIAETPVIRT